MKTLLVVLSFLLAVFLGSMVISSFINPASPQWHGFEGVVALFKWIAIPISLYLVPKWAGLLSSRPLSPASRTFLLKCQLVGGLLFVGVEVGRVMLLV
ncbi:MAG: hypothetical protein ACRCYV_08575 [Aeromonas sp.]